MKKRITKIDGNTLVQGGGLNKENSIKTNELLVNSSNGKVTLTNKDKEIISQGEHSDEDYNELKEEYDAIKNLPKLSSISVNVPQAYISDTSTITSESYNYQKDFYTQVSPSEWKQYLSESITALINGEITEHEFIEYLSTNIKYFTTIKASYNTSEQKVTFTCDNIHISTSFNS